MMMDDPSAKKASTVTLAAAVGNAEVTEIIASKKVVASVISFQTNGPLYDQIKTDQTRMTHERSLVAVAKAVDQYSIIQNSFMVILTEENVMLGNHNLVYKNDVNTTQAQDEAKRLNILHTQYVHAHEALTQAEADLIGAQEENDQMQAHRTEKENRKMLTEKEAPALIEFYGFCESLSENPDVKRSMNRRRISAR